MAQSFLVLRAISVLRSLIGLLLLLYSTTYMPTCSLMISTLEKYIPLLKA